MVNGGAHHITPSDSKVSVRHLKTYGMFYIFGQKALEFLFKLPLSFHCTFLTAIKGKNGFYINRKFIK